MSESPTLDVRLLGQFKVMRDGKPLSIPTRQAQTLFAYLILNAGKTNRREKLAGLLWPDSGEENARSNLRHELWRLRKVISAEAEPYFLVDDLTIAFNPHSHYSLDVDQLKSAPLEGERLEDLIEGLSVYQGELLPGFYDEWVFAERGRLEALFEAKAARLLEILQSQGRWVEVQDWATRWISLGQLPEPAYRALMVAYASAGDLSKMAAAYEHFTKALEKDRGVKPSEETQALYVRLKGGWRKNSTTPLASSGSRPPEPPAETAVRAFQLPKVRRSNLPKSLTSFIGREKEIQQVVRLVSRERLVTITGSGGVGKTRLALEAAKTLTPRFSDGAWWVELASLTGTNAPQRMSTPRSPSRSRRSSDPPSGCEDRLCVDLVAQAVVNALRISDTPGVPVLGGMMAHLQDKELLLVLDNCEHLIDACAELVEPLLKECPGLTILATSREALGVPGEKAWRLPSLSLPDRGASAGSQDIYQSEAVSLFIERTADVLPGYQPGEVDLPAIAQVCLRLGGIPLAIELAAARMALLSAKEIAARLDSRFSLLTSGHRTALPRHRTLWAAIEWSYDLLGEAEKVLLRRLSVFAGSFPLEAAEAVCAGEDIESGDVLTILGRLADKSLLNVEPVPQDKDLSTRFHLLDTIRSFGLLKLEEAHETLRMRDRHSDYYVNLVETAEPELLFHNQIHWYRLIQAEQDNLRAVIEWSAESDRAESALRLVGATMWPWFSIGSSREGRDLALKTLDLPSAFRQKAYRARALNTAGYLQWVLGEMDSARANIEEALAILKDSNDEASLAWSMQLLGLVLTSEGKYDLADAAMQDGVAIARKLGDIKSSSLSLVFQGDIALQRGHPQKARQIYEESARLLRSYGNVNFLAYPARRLGYLALEQNDISEAWGYFRESLNLNREVGDRRGVAACLISMAALALRLEKPDVAAILYGAVESRLESLSNLLYLDQAELRRLRLSLPAYLDEAAFTAAFTKGWEMTDEQAIDLVGQIFSGGIGSRPVLEDA